MTRDAETIAMILDRLRYQILRPSVTTCGPCPSCDNTARGSGTCADCLIALLPRDRQPLARKWALAARDAQRAWDALAEASDGA